MDVRVDRAGQHEVATGVPDAVVLRRPPPARAAPATDSVLDRDVGRGRRARLRQHDAPPRTSESMIIGCPATSSTSTPPVARGMEEQRRARRPRRARRRRRSRCRRRRAVPTQISRASTSTASATWWRPGPRPARKLATGCCSSVRGQTSSSACPGPNRRDRHPARHLAADRSRRRAARPEAAMSSGRDADVVEGDGRDGGDFMSPSSAGGSQRRSPSRARSRRRSRRRGQRRASRASRSLRRRRRPLDLVQRRLTAAWSRSAACGSSRASWRSTTSSPTTKVSISCGASTSWRRTG